MTPAAAISILIFGISPALLAQTAPPRIPPRVAEEADVLEQNAARILTQESLEQRSVMPPGLIPVPCSVTPAFFAMASNFERSSGGG